MKNLLLMLLFSLACLVMSLQVSAEKYTGLWVGSVEINAVSEPQSGPVLPITNSLAVVITNNPPILLTNAGGTVIGTNLYSTNYLQLVRTNQSLLPTPTGSSALLKLLIHINENHEARLLKEVTLMVTKEAVPRPVLVTDRSLLTRFDAASSRNGGQVAQRITTTHFDFSASHLVMAGKVSTNSGNVVSVTNFVASSSPTNPFKHKYHPDHDNLDPTFRFTQEEAYNISRVISLSFSPAGSGSTAGNYGYDHLEGIYREVISGLTSTNIVASGSFNLRRVSALDKLNDRN